MDFTVPVFLIINFIDTKAACTTGRFFCAQINDAKRYNFISGKMSARISHTFIPCK